MKYLLIVSIVSLNGEKNVALHRQELRKDVLNLKSKAKTSLSRNQRSKLVHKL